MNDVFEEERYVCYLEVEIGSGEDGGRFSIRMRDDGADIRTLIGLCLGLVDELNKRINGKKEEKRLKEYV